MRAEFSRWSFDLPRHRRKHYEGVLTQQGRVWLDADSNEDVVQRLEDKQSTNRDIIGPSGCPHDNAFKISDGTELPTENPTDFNIGGGPGPLGRFYVQGVMARLERPTTYLTQPEPPFDPAAEIDDRLPFDRSSLQEDLFAVVYLEVWRRLVTFLEDDSIREIALGGPDTTGRVKNVAQVKIALLPDHLDCAAAESFIPDDGHARLSTVETPVPASAANPCRIAGDTFRGRDNRLYRVEVHDPGEIPKETVFTSYVFLAADAPSETKELSLERELTLEEDTAARAFGIEVFDVDGNVVSVKVASVNGKTVTLSADADADVKHDFRVADDARITIRGKVVELTEAKLANAVKAGDQELELTNELAIGSINDSDTKRRPRSGIAIIGTKTASEVVRYVIPDEKSPTKLHLTSALRNGFDAGAVVKPRLAKVKWSRDNAAFGVRIEKIGDDRKTLTLASLGRDQASLLAEGNWVEIGSSVNELQSELAPQEWLAHLHGFLTTIHAVDLDQSTIVLEDELPRNFKDHCPPLILRRWDEVVDFERHESPILDLGDGINVRLGGYDLRAGDYWQFTARSEDGSVERLVDAEPFGIRRYRAPLAIGRWTNEKWTNADVSKVLGIDIGMTQDQTLSEIRPLAIAKKPDGASDDDWTKTVDDGLGQLGTEFKRRAAFHLVHDCRRVFAPLTSIKNQLVYLSGDGQESKPTGDLGETLRVFVPSALAGEGEVKVRFRIVTPNNSYAASPPPGELFKSVGDPAKTDIEIETVEGIAACIWKLATQGSTATEYPPRLQVVEATFAAAPSIRFNAVLGILTFSYMGGDGQIADKHFKSTVPLQVTVFEGAKPAAASVQFSVVGGIALGGPVPTNAEGIAQIDAGAWTLDKTKPGERQTVEARLLDSLGNPILQPIHFSARIDPNLPTDDVITIGEDIRLVQGDIPLVNDKVYLPSQLVEGIKVPLDHPLNLAGALNRATCSVSVEVPTKMFGMNALNWAKVYLPVVLDAKVSEPSDNVICWNPGDDAQNLLRTLEGLDDTNRLLARLTIQGSFIQDKEGRLIDGDNRAADPNNPTALKFPSGDGRRGGDFRMWFWLSKRVVIDVPAPLFGALTGEVTDSEPIPITSLLTIDHAKMTIEDNVNNRFIIKSIAEIPDFNDFTLKDTQSIRVTFDNSAGPGAVPAAGTTFTAKLKITTQDGTKLDERELKVTT